MAVYIGLIISNRNKKCQRLNQKEGKERIEAEVEEEDLEVRERRRKHKFIDQIKGIITNLFVLLATILDY